MIRSGSWLAISVIVFYILRQINKTEKLKPFISILEDAGCGI